jgi:hypothetical protein
MVGMLTMNSFVSLMRTCEYRFGEMLIATNGGFMEVGIAHARVIMFGLPVLPWHVTSTVCIGWTNLNELLRSTGVFSVILLNPFFSV